VKPVESSRAFVRVQQSIQRAPCSHTIAFEQRRVSGLGANQIVASIVGWPDNHVMRGEYFERRCSEPTARGVDCRY